jgi:hypothetical protein
MCPCLIRRVGYAEVVTPAEPGSGVGVYFAQVNRRDWMDCSLDEILTASHEERNVVASHVVQGILAAKDEMLDEPPAKDQALKEMLKVTDKCDTLYAANLLRIVAN